LLGGVVTWDLITGPVPATGTFMPRSFRTSSTRFTAIGPLGVTFTAASVLFSGGTRRDSPSAAINLTLAGPTANGRDQAGNFVNQDVHFYWIWNPTSSTVATIGSATFVPTGPTLPAGYTEWCYITTLRIGSTNNTTAYSGRVSGDKVFLEFAVWSTLTATVETAVTVAPRVPAIATQYELQAVEIGTANGSGQLDVALSIRQETGADTLSHRHQAAGLVNSSAWRNSPFPIILPNIAQQFFYQATNTLGSAVYDVFIAWYKVPNGD
jgi:hypothetical protein